MKKLEELKQIDWRQFPTPLGYITACGVESYEFNSLSIQFRSGSSELRGAKKKCFAIVFDGVNKILCRLESQLLESRNPNGILAILKAYAGERYGSEKVREELVERNKHYKNTVNAKNESLIKLC